MKIGVASDHAGTGLKSVILENLKSSGVQVLDLGVESGKNQSVDYPDYSAALAEKISAGALDGGVAICGTGIGMCITANKFPGIRAASVWDEFTAQMSKEHNNANMICLGARTLQPERAVQLVKLWLSAKFEGGRHQGRLDKITKIESSLKGH